MEEIYGKIKSYLDSEPHIYEKVGENEYNSEMYLDYRDRILEESTVISLAKQDNPRDALLDMIWEWEIGSDIYYYPELFKELKKVIPEYEEYEDEINQWCFENVHFYYNPDEILDATDAYINITIDSGNANYDDTCDNILNWYGQYSHHSEIDEYSSILWLARQQKCVTEFRKAIRKYKNNSYKASDYSPLVQSMVVELENACVQCSTLTFLVKMTLGEYFNLIEDMKENPDGSITLKKDVMCGLYDSWNGGGSVLELNLRNDVKIPYNVVGTCKPDGCVGYSVTSVYGMCASAWKNVKVA